MPDGRFRKYYWQIRTLLSEKDHLLDMGHPAYEMCEELPTHPHHVHEGRRPTKGANRASPLDVPQVDFVTILGRVVGEYLGNSEAAGG